MATQRAHVAVASTLMAVVHIGWSVRAFGGERRRADVVFVALVYVRLVLGHGRSPFSQMKRAASMTGGSVTVGEAATRQTPVPAAVPTATLRDGGGRTLCVRTELLAVL